MKGPQFALGDLFRADVRTSREADSVNTHLQSILGFDYRYQVARLAIGLSLAEPSAPSAPGDLLGKPIRGETLFGQEEADLALWAALIVEHAAAAPASRKEILDLVAAHWNRGLEKLKRLWSKHEGAAPEFLCALGDSASRA